MVENTARTLAIIEKLYAATGAGAWTLAEEYLTDDLFITEADALPYAGLYQGRGALQELFLKVMSMMDVERLDLEQITAGGDYVIALVSFIFKDPALPRARLAEMYRFRGDKVCEIRPYYFEPAQITAAVEAKKRASS
ncbi:MAG: nuclear transport factor 2 family protein [Caulobacterales bacterium]